MTVLSSGLEQGSQPLTKADLKSGRTPTQSFRRLGFLLPKYLFRT